jgi:hypothetical protein
MYDKAVFIEAVLAMSGSDDLQAALGEWRVTGEDTEHGGSQCFCGHPIRRVYTLRNIRNGNSLESVGSKCVTRFGLKEVLRRFRQGKKVVKQGPARGLTYDAVCRDRFYHLKWLSRKRRRSPEERALLEYARWLFS